MPSKKKVSIIESDENPQFSESSASALESSLSVEESSLFVPESSLCVSESSLCVSESSLCVSESSASQSASIHYVYMLRCKDGSLYTGWTTSLEERIKTHNKGTGAKYTRSRLPVELVYYEAFTNKSDALKREHAIKSLTPLKKRILIQK